MSPMRPDPQAGERERAEALVATGLLDTPPSEAFDQIARLAKDFFGVPIALISFVDSKRQWFKSRIGIEVAETPRGHSLCSRAIERSEVMVVEDALLDVRFADNPLVLGEPRIRFYAGAPLVLPSGHALGTICVIDREPRTFSEPQRRQLATLAQLVMSQIELHRRAGRIHEATRLPNRTQMAEDIESRAAVDPSGRCSVLLIELISQRRLHETLRAVGAEPLEAALRGVVATLRAAIGPGPALYQVGESRLCVALPDGSREEREAFATRAIERISQPFDVAGVAVQLRPVGGIADFEFAARGGRGADALRLATSALMEARERGARLAWHDKALDAAHRRAYRLMQDIPGGLMRGEFRLVYQPKLNLRAGGFTGVEALARWRHPTLGDVSPGEFIPLVERTALIHRFTPWALGMALDQAVQWRDQGLDLTVAVNVSSRNLEAEGFVAQVARLCQERGVAPSKLHIECTENAAMTGDATRAALVALREMGAQISLDDFGMGYSNLACLRGLPVQLLKIDQSLVKPIDTDPSALQLARSLIALGHALGFRMLAEGVETQRARDLLVDAGCDALQGYLLGRPMEAEAIPGFLSNARRP